MKTQRSDTYCSYPDCLCVVSTSTSQPEPVCPRGLQPLTSNPSPEDIQLGMSEAMGGKKGHECDR